MRSLLTVVLVVAAPAFAQGGTWTGYVRGWVPDAPRPGLVAAPGPGLRLDPGARSQLMRLQLLALQQQQANAAAGTAYVLGQQQAAAQRDEATEVRQTQLARQQLALEQETAERERRLAEQRLAAQQALATQQQQLAQQQLAAQEALAAQNRQLAAQLAEQQRQLAAQTEALEQQRRQLGEAPPAQRTGEKASPAEKADPRDAKVKGPDIHHWVDDEGVHHYSTKPPPGR